MAGRDRNHVAIQIEEMLAKARPLFTNDCCIYRVPHELRELNHDAYTPKILSIGPFHHGNEKLLNMEGDKQVYCQHFIDRSEASLDDLVSCVQELEPMVRRCYSENIELGVDELVKVILVDCGFIIEHFFRFCSCRWPRDDAISMTPWLIEGIRSDLVLVENQLPFFAFMKLYNLAFASRLNGDQHPSFPKLASRYFLTSEPEEFPAHFTDLFRTSYLQPADTRPSRKHEVLTHLYSASELKEAGVKFKVNKRSLCLLDVQLSSRILKIPLIILEDSTEILLRNMVALEQCHYPKESYITDYVELLDFLINTDKDVDVLVKHGIILNWLGDSNAVAKLFNGLAKNITVTSSNTDYLRICKELNNYYKHPWHTKMATLRRDYCNTPWKTAASIAGIALLILTVIQTLCSILQVVQQF